MIDNTSKEKLIKYIEKNYAKYYKKHIVLMQRIKFDNDDMKSLGFYAYSLICNQNFNNYNHMEAILNLKWHQLINRYYVSYSMQKRTGNTFNLEPQAFNVLADDRPEYTEDNTMNNFLEFLKEKDISSYKKAKQMLSKVKRISNKSMPQWENEQKSDISMLKTCFLEFLQNNQITE